MTQQQLVEDLNEVGVSLTQFRTAWNTGCPARTGMKLKGYIDYVNDAYDAIYAGFTIHTQDDGIDWFAKLAELLKIINKRKKT
jgi:hypothetical protein